MLKINKKILSISLSAMAFTLLSGKAMGATTQACEQKVFADLFVSISLPSGSFSRKIASDVHYSTLQDSDSADNSAQIQTLINLRNGVPSLPLPQSIKNQITQSYNRQIKALQDGEKDLAKSRCADALKNQANRVAAPHKFVRRGAVIYK